MKTAGQLTEADLHGPYVHPETGLEYEDFWEYFGGKNPADCERNDFIRIFRRDGYPEAGLKVFWQTWDTFNPLDAVQQTAYNARYAKAVNAAGVWCTNHGLKWEATKHASTGGVSLSAFGAGGSGGRASGAGGGGGAGVVYAAIGPAAKKVWSKQLVASLSKPSAFGKFFAGKPKPTP